MPDEPSFLDKNRPLLIIGGILLLIIAALIACIWYFDPFNFFYSKTIILGDQAGDWISPEGPSTINPDPYPVDAADLKSITIDIDNQNLYVKYQFNGKIPEDIGSIPVNDDHLNDYTFFLAIDHDNNPSTGSREYGGAEVLLTGTMHRGNGTLDTKYWTDPNTTGLFENSHLAQVTEGGPSYDYVRVAYPLSGLGLAKSEDVTVNSAVVMTSDKYSKVATMDRLDNLDEISHGDMSAGYFHIRLGGGIMAISSYNQTIKLI
ncbi:MAG TPA: hypothetical protein VK436_01380 [Methanocella sp.]|nr:hypothetical protein [Methanocella sp.]